VRVIFHMPLDQGKLQQNSSKVHDSCFLELGFLKLVLRISDTIILLQENAAKRKNTNCKSVS